MTLGALRSSIEAEGIPAPSQHIYHNGQLITDASKTLQELQISDGDMLALHVRDMRGNTGVAQPPAPQQQRQPQQQQQQAAGAAAQQDPELVRLQFLGDPRLQAELRRRNPQIADALNDPQRFAQLMRQGNDSQEDERRQRMREIEQLNRDEFNPDAQARIEEMIRQQNVMENLQNAMEYNPECTYSPSPLSPAYGHQLTPLQLSVAYTCSTSMSKSTVPRLKLWLTLVPRQPSCPLRVPKLAILCILSIAVLPASLVV